MRFTRPTLDGSTLWVTNPWMVAYFVLCALIAAALGAFAGLTGAGIGAIVGLILALIFFPSFFFRVGPDILCVQTFFGEALQLNDTWALKARSQYVTIVLIPGSQEVFSTANEAGEARSFTVQLLQGLGVGRTDEQLVVLRTVYRISIWDYPSEVVKAFYREFACRNGETTDAAMARAVREKVEPDVFAVLAANADTVLQGTEVESLLTDVGTANAALLAKLRAPLLQIGINVLQVAIDRVDDVQAGGYVASLSQGQRAGRQAIARQQQADADRDAGIAEADSRRAVLVQQELTEQQALAVAAVRAQREIQPLLARLNVLAGQEEWIAAMVADYNQLPPDQKAEVLKGLGTVAWPQGGNFAGVNVDSPIVDAFRGLVAQFAQSP